VSLWKGNLHKNKNYVNNPQTVFQKHSNVIEILQFFDFGQQSFFQFYIFCQKENETIEHIFWGCENVQNLLGQVNSWFGDKDINQTFLKKTLIFGDVDKVYKDDVYNAILLNIKYYIYTNRCLKKKLSFHSLKACLINLS
jgi:hypothetical protein